jgi:hypothetical protein
MRKANPRRSRRLRETSQEAHNPVHIDRVAIGSATTIAVATAVVAAAVAATVEVGATIAARGSGKNATMAIAETRGIICPGGAYYTPGTGAH